MKSILISLVAVFSVSVFACPNIEGKYSCEDDGSNETKLTLVNNVPTYKINATNDDGSEIEVMIAFDGIERTQVIEDGDEATVNLTVKNTCNTNNLTMSSHYLSTVYNYEITDVSTLTKDANGNLIIDTASVITEEGNTRNEREISTCTKIN